MIEELSIIKHCLVTLKNGKKVFGYVTNMRELDSKGGFIVIGTDKKRFYQSGSNIFIPERNIEMIMVDQDLDTFIFIDNMYNIPFTDYTKYLMKDIMIERSNGKFVECCNVFESRIEGDFLKLSLLDSPTKVRTILFKTEDINQIITFTKEETTERIYRPKKTMLARLLDDDMFSYIADKCEAEGTNLREKIYKHLKENDIIPMALKMLFYRGYYNLSGNKDIALAVVDFIEGKPMFPMAEKILNEVKEDSTDDLISDFDEEDTDSVDMTDEMSKVKDDVIDTSDDKSEEESK